MAQTVGEGVSSGRYAALSPAVGLVIRPTATYAGAVLAGLGMTGCAASPAPGAGASGLWWFATLALLGLALAGYFIGRLNERQRQAAALFEARSRQAALLASLDGTAWRTDASHRFVEWADPAAQHAVAAPAWANDPALLPLLQAQRGFADLRVPTPRPTEQPAGPDAGTPPPEAADGHAHTSWLLRGQPMLDAQGRFAGFMGTARAVQDTGHAAALAAQTGAAPAAAGEAALATPAATTAASTAATTAALAAARAESDEADNFSFTVAHDLRAPIRVVDGFTRIVKEDYGHLLDRVGNDHLERVLNAAARMNKMIDALLTLASLSNQPLTRQPVNLSQIAHFVIDELQRAHPAREVEVKIEDGLVVVGDPTLLRLVLENLLGNAWKYSSRTAQAQISLSAIRHGAGRAFVVRDNGAGFDMRSAERLFGVFQRLHGASEFPGHGVGLASARRIVRRHGGDIWAESEPARGASFSFTLAEH